ncbi:uncharacterized protein LOC106705303 [Latimeria chalumnae]|uniref:uncharacterized protein LOC106705303 n=1 Tax=Latimeria chalumnae TaxID=7897 RepID=UPI0006D8E674|nr:PREDICTED: uncharacterized protein LOC106705303 [Latimeria chalumnae]|eukprot:XP_014349860.1 PREDICTED: uncharacterized protein LOC106705303 [Latimeria chalumnae]
MHQRLNSDGLPQYHLRRIGSRASLPEVLNIMDFHKPTSLIGRNSGVVDFFISSSVAANSLYLSRTHARVIRSSWDSTHRLIDSSLTGTYVNDARIDGEVVLHEGDTVTFGHPHGNEILPGTRIRQPNSEYYFLFERCCCTLDRNPVMSSEVNPVGQVPPIHQVERCSAHSQNQATTSEVRPVPAAPQAIQIPLPLLTCVQLTGLSSPRLRIESNSGLPFMSGLTWASQATTTSSASSATSASQLSSLQNSQINQPVLNPTFQLTPTVIPAVTTLIPQTSCSPESVNSTQEELRISRQEKPRCSTPRLNVSRSASPEYACVSTVENPKYRPSQECNLRAPSANKARGGRGKSAGNISRFEMQETVSATQRSSSLCAFSFHRPLLDCTQNNQTMSSGEKRGCEAEISHCTISVQQSTASSLPQIGDLVEENFNSNQSVHSCLEEDFKMDDSWSNKSGQSFLAPSCSESDSLVVEDCSNSGINEEINVLEEISNVNESQICFCSSDAGNGHQNCSEMATVELHRAAVCSVLTGGAASQSKIQQNPVTGNFGEDVDQSSVQSAAVNFHILDLQESYENKPETKKFGEVYITNLHGSECEVMKEGTAEMGKKDGMFGGFSTGCSEELLKERELAMLPVHMETEEEPGGSLRTLEDQAPWSKEHPKSAVQEINSVTASTKEMHSSNSELKEISTLVENVTQKNKSMGTSTIEVIPHDVNRECYATVPFPGRIANGFKDSDFLMRETQKQEIYMVKNVTESFHMSSPVKAANSERGLENIKTSSVMEPEETLNNVANSAVKSQPFAENCGTRNIRTCVSESSPPFRDRNLSCCSNVCLESIKMWTAEVESNTACALLLNTEDHLCSVEEMLLNTNEDSSPLVLCNQLDILKAPLFPDKDQSKLLLQMESNSVREDSSNLSKDKCQRSSIDNSKDDRCTISGDSAPLQSEDLYSKDDGELITDTPHLQTLDLLPGVNDFNVGNDIGKEDYVPPLGAVTVCVNKESKISSAKVEQMNDQSYPFAQSGSTKRTEGKSFFMEQGKKTLESSEINLATALQCTPRNQCRDVGLIDEMGTEQNDVGLIKEPNLDKPSQCNDEQNDDYHMEINLDDPFECNDEQKDVGFMEETDLNKLPQCSAEENDMGLVEETDLEKPSQCNSEPNDVGLVEETTLDKPSEYNEDQNDGSIEETSLDSLPQCNSQQNYVGLIEETDLYKPSESSNEQNYVGRIQEADLHKLSQCKAEETDVDLLEEADLSKPSECNNEQNGGSLVEETDLLKLPQCNEEQSNVGFIEETNLEKPSEYNDEQNDLAKEADLDKPPQCNEKQNATIQGFSLMKIQLPETAFTVASFERKHCR